MAAPSAPRTPSPTPHSSSMTPIANTTSSLPQLSSQIQRNLKQKVRMEYSGQVFASNELFSKIFRSTVPKDKIQCAINDCIERFEQLPPLVDKEAGEEKHYPPFVDRLNAVKESLILHKCMGDSIYLGVEFEVYDRLMAEGVGNDAALKPDILARRIPSGIHNDSPNGSVHWEDVELCVEVKDKYGEMVAQGATYARSMSYAQRNRRFVLMIFFEQKKGHASFGLFTPAWLCLSKDHYDLRAKHGQRGFIEDMARIWSCTDRWSAGFEDTCNNIQCFLKGYGTFSYRENICYRTSLRGRRTRVDLIDVGRIWTYRLPVQNKYIFRQLRDQDEYYRATESSEKSSEQLQESTSLSRKLKSSRTSPKPFLIGESTSRGIRFSHRLFAKNYAKQMEILKVRLRYSLSELPVRVESPSHRKKAFILKDSWPLVSRETQEVDIFGITGDNGSGNDNTDKDENEDERDQEFGVAVILDCLRVTNSEGELSDTASLLPHEVESLSRVWDENGPKPQNNPQTATSIKPEERVHICLLIGTQGDSLENASGPRELVQAVLHAMIGYSVTFRKRWLHRDVSIGNVLLMKKAKKRKEIKGFGDILTEDILAKHFSKCVGFISDGDLAVKWDQPDRERAKQRSGTPPFISCRLLETVNEEAFHSALDDLESFVWVAFWAILSIMRNRRAIFTDEEEHYWTYMRSLDLTVLLRKRGFHERLGDQYFASLINKEKKKGTPPPPKLPSPAFSPFVALLMEWLTLAFSLETFQTKKKLEITSNDDEHEKVVQEWIGKYLSIGLKHLDELPKTWDYLP